MGKTIESLVLIPGLLCDQRLWSHQVAGLASCAEIVVADISTESSIREMAAAILDRAPERFSLAGFSLGSQVALEIMQAAKDRVVRLALLSATHGGLPPSVEVAIREAMATIRHGNFDQYLEAVYPSYVAARRVGDSALKRAFVEMAHVLGADAGLRQMQALLAIRGPFRNLDQIHCTTVVVGGQEDRRTTPADHEALAAEIPGSELVIVGDAGHFTPLEHPAIITALLQRWMAR